MATRTAFDFYMLGEVSEDQLNDPEKREQYKALWRKMDLDTRKPFMNQASQLRVTTAPATKSKSTRTAPGNKKAPSPYVIFVHHPSNKDPLKKAHPDKQPKEIVSILAAKWQTLTDEEKQPWIKLHEEKKAELLANPQPRATSNKNPGVKYKRAKSPYIHYSTDPAIRGPIQEANPDAKPNQITKLISEQWNKLSDEEKQPYKEKFEKEKKELAENPIAKPQKVPKQQPTPLPTPQPNNELHQQVQQLLEFKRQAEEKIQKLEERVAQLEG